MTPSWTRGVASFAPGGIESDHTTRRFFTLSLVICFRGLNPKSSYVRLHVRDRKSTRLNSSHTVISYAVFCLKKKKKKKKHTQIKNSKENRKTNKIKEYQ